MRRWRDKGSSGYRYWVLGIKDEDPWDIGYGSIASGAQVKCLRLSARLPAPRKERLKIGHSSFVILSNEVRLSLMG